MSVFAVGSAPLLHFGFEHMARAVLKFASHAPLAIAKHRPVVVIEFLDDLKCPASVQHIAADDLLLDRASDVGVTCLAQLFAGLAEEQIGVAHQLMKLIEQTAGAFYPLQGFRNGANGLYRRIIDAERAGADIRVVLSVVVRHVVAIPIRLPNASFTH